MKKLAKLIALLLACMMVFGSVTAAAETDVEETVEELAAEESNAEDEDDLFEEDDWSDDEDWDWEGLESEEIVWEEHNFKGICFVMPDTWEMKEESQELSADFDLGSQIVIRVYDPEIEEIAEEEMYGIDALAYVEGCEPEFLEHYEYSLNGLDFTCWYANNAQNESYYLPDEEIGGADFVLIKFADDDICGFVSIGMTEGEQLELLPGLIGFVFSLSEEDDDDIDDADIDDLFDDDDDEDEVIEEIAEEIEEEIEEAEEAEEAFEDDDDDYDDDDDDIDDDDDFDDDDDIDDEDYDDDDDDVDVEDDDDDNDGKFEGPVVWVDREAEGIRFRVPDSWDGYEEEASFNYEIGESINAAIEMISIEEVKQEVGSAEEFFEAFDTQIDELMGSIAFGGVQKYDPFEMNDLDVKLYYIPVVIEDMFRFDYLYFIFYGEDAAGYAVVSVISDGENSADEMVPLTFGFITSVGEADTDED